MFLFLVPASSSILLLTSATSYLNLRTELTFCQYHILHFKFLRTTVDGLKENLISSYILISFVALDSSIFPRLVEMKICDVWSRLGTAERTVGLGLEGVNCYQKFFNQRKLLQHSRLAACLCFYGLPTSYIRDGVVGGEEQIFVELVWNFGNVKF